MHQQRVATRVHGIAEATRVTAREVHVVMVAHIADDLAARAAPAPFVTVADAGEQLRDAPRFQI